MRSAVLLLWRARVRSSLRRVVALALLTAIGGGISLAVAAGARRTSGASDEAIELANGGEFGPSYGPHDLDEARARLDKLSALGDFSQWAGFAVDLPNTPVPGLQSFGYYEDRMDAAVERPIVLRGRLPHAADEVFINESTAAATGASVGDELDILIVDPASNFTEVIPDTLRVTAVGLFADEIYRDATATKPVLIYPKAFVAKHREQIVWGALPVQLAPGASRVEALAQINAAGMVVDKDRRADRDRATGAIRPLTVTLWALALLAGLATITVVSQALHRLVQRSPPETRSLAATGCGRALLLWADVAVAATVSLAGALGAVTFAVLASPLFPLGDARRIAELRGVDVDALVLGLGAVLLFVALPGLVAATALRRSRGSEVRPGWAPRVFGGAPAVGTGVRLATGRRGLLGTIGAVTVGLTAIVSAVVFTGSMDSLGAKPALAGFNWDLMGLDSYEFIDTKAVSARLRDVDGVERITGLTFSNATVDGAPLPISVWAAVKGSPWPTLIRGRAPQGPREMLVGEGTLSEIGSKIGETISVRFAADVETERGNPGFTIELTIVGTAVSPPIWISGSATPRLDEGLLVRQEDIVHKEVQFGSAVLFDLAEGTEPASIKRLFPGGDGLPDTRGVSTEWFDAAEPAEVAQARSAVDILALTILALLLAVMATVGHSLLGFVRERRGAYAVLKALGFTPRQIRTTVLWQSGLVIGAAIAVAVPLGVAAGRWLYQGFAGDIGVIVQPVVPMLPLLAALLGALALVQTVALVPAWQARRTDAATELRWE